MKNKTILSFMLTVLTGCTTKVNSSDIRYESHSISVIDDVTDSLLLDPIADPILQLFNCDQYPNDAFRLRHRLLADRMYTPIEVFSLSDKPVTEHKNRTDDPQYRRQEILNFYQKIRSFYKNINNEVRQSLLYSECLRTIGEELTWLVKDSASTKTLIVFSDLKERTDIFDVYSSGIPSQEQFDLAIAKYKLFPKSLIGVKIVFVFQAKSRDDERLFSGMVGLYQRSIINRGGTMIIQASNYSFIL